MSIVDVIQRLATGTYELTRQGGSFTDGRWVPGGAARYEVVAVVQPASGKDLQRLPEGQRTTDMIAVWAGLELKLRDRIAYAGGSYELKHVELWEAGGFWKALAGRV